MIKLPDLPTEEQRGVSLELVQPVQPDYNILIDDVNITEKIRDRLIDLIIKDEDGIKSDSVEITFSDPEQEVVLPRKGVKLSVLIGYDNIVTDMGFFVVDSVAHRDHPILLELVLKVRLLIKAVKALERFRI